MERPASRSGTPSLSMSGLSKAPTGSSMMQPDRPTTAAAMMMPPRTASGRPPGTSAGPPKTGGPPKTALRMGTANGRPTTASARAATALTVENRPITNHGLTGMKTAVAGGRQVFDKNYYLNELRTKRAELIKATTEMKDELERYERKSDQFTLLERRHADLSKEAKTLHDQLADYNMVLDKIGSQTTIAEIQAEYAVIKDRNDMQRKRVDSILTERLGLEQKTKQVEVKILEIQASLEQRINSLPPKAREQYLQLQEEQQVLTSEAHRMEEILTDLDRTLTKEEGEMARNTFKQRALQLQENVKNLMDEKYKMQQEEEKGKMSPEERREALMADVKRHNAEIEHATTAIRDLQENIKRMESRIGGGSAETADEASRREKFEELVAKERELNNFMDSFPSSKAEKLKELEGLRDSVVERLERINKLQGVMKSALPNQKKFKEMQDELEYKRIQLENAGATDVRLKDELQLRKIELEKIDTLEDKIKQELKGLNDKAEQLRKELVTYEKVDDVNAKAELTKARLEKLRESLLKRKDLLKVVVAERAWKSQAKQAQLRENPVAATLDKMETKLKQLHQSVFTMQDFIKQKESEMNYKPLANAITMLADELNGYVCATAGA